MDDANKAASDKEKALKSLDTAVAAGKGVSAFKKAGKEGVEEESGELCIITDADARPLFLEPIPTKDSELKEVASTIREATISAHFPRRQFAIVLSR